MISEILYWLIVLFLFVWIVKYIVTKGRVTIEERKERQDFIDENFK